MCNITELTCRVCLHEQQVLINVFDELEELQTNLSFLLDKCGDIQVDEDDVFPKYLCEECTRELLISAKFRDKCDKSKEMLEIVLKENRFQNESDQLIEFSSEDGVKETISVAEEPENTVHIPEMVSHSSTIHNIEETESNQHVADVDSAMMFASNFEEAAADAVITFDETSAEEPVSVSVVEYDGIPIENHDYEVNIDLSDTAFIKSMPVKVKKIKSFKCDICGAAFVQAINLQKHLQKTHAPAQCYTCTTCDHWFSIEMELFKHVKYCKGSSSDDDYSKDNTKKRISKSNVNNRSIECHRTCVYCEKEFQTPFALRMHLRTHTGERPFQCQYCDKAFKTQSSLSTHIKRHTGQADFVCNLCGKSFYERGNLDVHLRSHTGERPHECTKCQQSFSRVFLLEMHMRTHTGEKPFTCSFCGRSFRQKSEWKNHQSTHTGIKKYNCHLCSKGYIKRSSLVQHMRTHSHSALQPDLEEVSQLSSEDICQVEQSEIIHSFDDIIETEEILLSKEVSQ